MPAADLNALYVQLRRRMIESGEWEQVQFALRSKLNESGWLDDLKHRSIERAKANSETAVIPFKELLQEMTPHAQNTVPLAVKREITSLIRQNIEKQFE